jgi:hypothetical protein
LGLRGRDAAHLESNGGVPVFLIERLKLEGLRNDDSQGLTGSPEHEF